MKSLAGLLILAMLMSGCASVRVTSDCPVLVPPPAAVVAALKGANDQAVDQWAVALERHYQMLDACRGR